jgi:hypothetical protein
MIFTEDCRCGKQVSRFTTNEMCDFVEEKWGDCGFVQVIPDSKEVECAKCEEERKKKEKPKDK